MSASAPSAAASGPIELEVARADALKRVFLRYDFNGDGFLDVTDMRVFGWALSLRQRVPEVHEASLQIQRADTDGDQKLRFVLQPSRVDGADARGAWDPFDFPCHAFEKIELRGAPLQ